MEFHPSQIPAIKTFEINDEKSAVTASDQIVEQGFEGIKGGYLILMPKEKRTAKRIGYTITTSVNYGLRRNGDERSIRYWTYHHDDKHYAIMMVSAKVLESLGL
ncbi:MAG: hypothetical protein K8823_1656 [Cenarchaeum symbiont of Oopsacas minuta]|nr:hypothetical protein [Cenarchaeum symbiont of Oopsacas minuta]